MVKTSQQIGKLPADNVVEIVGAQKRKYRFKYGTIALREIKKSQKSTGLLLKRGPFKRLVHEITQDTRVNGNFMYQKNAIDALQVAAEAYMIEVFKGANTLSTYSKRDTVCVKDMQAYMQVKYT